MPVSTAGSKRAIFRQVCELIPPHLVPKVARKHGIASRGITPWSHIVSMLFAQFTHAIGLNDVVDALRANRASQAAEALPRNRLASLTIRRACASEMTGCCQTMARARISPARTRP